MNNYPYGSGQQGYYPWNQGNSNQNNSQYFPPPPPGPPPGPPPTTSASSLAKTLNIFSGKPSYTATQSPYPNASYPIAPYTTPPTALTPHYAASPDNYSRGQTYAPYSQHITTASYPPSQTPEPQNYQPNTATPHYGNTSIPPNSIPIEPPPPPYPQHSHSHSNPMSPPPPPPPQYAPQTPVPQLHVPVHVSDPPKDSPVIPSSSPFRPPSTGVSPIPTNSNSQDADQERAQLRQRVVELQKRLASTETELQKAQGEITRAQGEITRLQGVLSQKTYDLTLQSSQLNGALNEGQKAQVEIARLQAEVSQKTNELNLRGAQLNGALNEAREAQAMLIEQGNEQNMLLQQLTTQFRELEVENQEMWRGVGKDHGFNVGDGPYGQAGGVEYNLQRRDDEIASLYSTPVQTVPSYTGGQTVIPARGNAATGQLQASNEFQHAPSNGQAWWEDQEVAPSKALEEWRQQKNQEHAGSVIVLNSFMEEFIGTENVKSHLLKTKAKIDTMLRQGVSLTEEAFDLLITGNPGTNTEFIALIYSGFLVQYLGGPPIWACKQRNASECLTSEITGLTGIEIVKADLDSISMCVGGVYVLTNVHLLVESTAESPTGTKVLDYVFTEMEKARAHGRLTFVLSGNTTAVEGHATLATQFPCRLHLEDFTDEEILLWLEETINGRYKNKMKVEGGTRGMYMQVVARRIGRGRNGKDGKFESSKDIERAFARIRERQGERLSRETRAGIQSDIFFFTKEDLIGPNPSQVKSECRAWKELNSMIGLRAVKDSLNSMVELIETNYWRELHGKPPSMQVALNRVFLGSPGTGKTSVAKLYGQILAHFGLLSTSEVVVKSAADFVGSLLGQSEAITKAILAATVGKVLIIDEAYLLHPPREHGTPIDIYKVAIIDTIVAEVQSIPGEDRCVLLLGYEEEMKRLFQEANPGLARRFALEDAFYFEDYSEAELHQIFELKLTKQGLRATDEAKHVAGEILGRARIRPNFGNGGEVDNVISQAKLRYQSRISKLPPQQRPDEVLFIPDDFDPDFARGASAAANCQKLFEDMIGCEHIVQKLEDYQRIAQNAKRAGCPMHELIPTNFLFKGPPGTGKTVVARKMGKVYYDMGFLATDKVIECSSSDLISVFSNETPKICQKMFEKALGQVLFIDEAYRLAEGGGRDALNEIVDILTKKKYIGKMVVILAGYDQDMNRLLSVNSGLSSRFPEEIMFKSMSPAHCVEILCRELEQKRISANILRDTNSMVNFQLCDMIAKLSALPLWGNARDIIALAKSIVGGVYKMEQVGPGGPILTPDQVLGTVRHLLQEREARAGNNGATW